MAERVIRDMGREKGRPVPEGGRIWTPLSGWEDRCIHSSSPSHSAPPDLGQDEWVVRRKRGAKAQTSGNTPGKGHRTDFSSGGHCKLCQHFMQIELIFMQIPTRALLVAKGKQESSDGRRWLFSILLLILTSQHFPPIVKWLGYQASTVGSQVQTDMTSFSRTRAPFAG